MFCLRFQSVFNTTTQKSDIAIANNLIILKSDKMSGINSVIALYKEFKTEWDKPQHNLKKCGQLLDQLKVEKYQYYASHSECNITPIL